MVDGSYQQQKAWRTGRKIVNTIFTPYKERKLKERDFKRKILFRLSLLILSVLLCWKINCLIYLFTGPAVLGVVIWASHKAGDHAHLCGRSTIQKVCSEYSRMSKDKVPSLYLALLVQSLYCHFIVCVNWVSLRSLIESFFVWFTFFRSLLHIRCANSLISMKFTKYCLKLCFVSLSRSNK